MNPVFFFDELDKISKTDKGDEIANALIQLTDPIQSQYFQDRYLGSNTTLDLSQCIFVFAYNSRKNINRILLDRIYEITLPGYSIEEKIQIARNHLMSSIIKDVGLGKNHPDLTDDALVRLIDKYTDESGLRQLMNVLYEIYREINILFLDRTLNGTPSGTLAGSRKRRADITSDNVEEFIKTCKPEYIMKAEKIDSVGKAVGLYVTEHGSFGILPIEAKWVPSNKFFGIQCTGNLGKVMGESVQVAKLVAWGNTPETIRAAWSKKWKKQRMSIHVHCADAATNKEGPSAGVALTLAIWSLMNGVKIPSTLCMTGEISLSGQVLPIGGLKEKLSGARRAGCTDVIFPLDNLKEVSGANGANGTSGTSETNGTSGLGGTLALHPVSTFTEILDKWIHLSSPQRVI
jgi:ATP-dependent Lon protease